MSDVYADHKDDDGFLYIMYSGEAAALKQASLRLRQLEALNA